MRLSTLVLIKGGYNITCAINIFSFTFHSSRFDTVDLQYRVLASAPLSAFDHALNTTMTLASPIVCNAFGQLPERTSTLFFPHLQPILSTGLTLSGTRLRGFGLVLGGRNEDFALNTSHT